MRRTAALVLGLAFAAAACTRGIEQAAEVLESPSSPNASVSPIPSPTPGGAIRIRSPREGDEILSPVLVRGVASTASGRVLVRIVDTEGTELAAVNVDVRCGAGCRGRFETRLAFFVPTRSSGSVQALELDRAGMVRQLAEVPVTIVPGA